MATCWAKCSDLFLYTKGKDVYLWRCNETTLMPMKTADFDDLGKVMDHQDLIGGKDAVFEWEKSAYIDLVAYISSRRLLVNSRGLVIAELHEFDQDGKMEENVLLPFYIRSLDVLSLKHFGLRDRTIPSRTVLYLETEGKAAPVEDSTTTTTTSSSTELDEGSKWRAEMEKQVAELKAAIKTLKSDKEAAERKAAVAEKEATELKETNKTLTSGKHAAEKEATELKEANKTLKSGKEGSDKQVKDLQDQIKSLTTKEPVWMSDLNIPKDDKGFVSVLWSKEENWMSGLIHNRHELTLVGPLGSFTTEDNSTNVRASYMYKLTSTKSGKVYTWKGVDFDSLPKKEMARFKLIAWSLNMYNGRPYVTKGVL